MAAAPKNWNGGRKALTPGEPTERVALRIAASRRARLRRLAERWGVSESDALRRAAEEAADREGIPRE